MAKFLLNQAGSPDDVRNSLKCNWQRITANEIQQAIDDEKKNKKRVTVLKMLHFAHARKVKAMTEGLYRMPLEELLELLPSTWHVGIDCYETYIRKAGNDGRFEIWIDKNHKINIAKCNYGWKCFGNIGLHNALLDALEFLISNGLLDYKEVSRG